MSIALSSFAPATTASATQPRNIEQLRAQAEELESVFLNTLDEVLAKRTTLADDMLALYHGRWNGSVEPVFEEYQY